MQGKRKTAFHPRQIADRPDIVGVVAKCAVEAPGRGLPIALKILNNGQIEQDFVKISRSLIDHLPILQRGLIVTSHLSISEAQVKACVGHPFIKRQNPLKGTNGLRIVLPS